MEELWQRLKEFWAKQDVKLGTPATPLHIEQFESAHQIKVPDDFKSYLLFVSGMNDKIYSTDDDIICFWQLENIKPLTEEYPDWSKTIDKAEEYFIFADHLIRSHDFAVRFSKEKVFQTPVFVLYGEPVQVASSFTEFIHRYIAEDADVTFPDG